MFKLSVVADKAEYLAHKDQTVFLGKKEVLVSLEKRNTKSGSWERGFKFGSITYGMLQRIVKKKSSLQPYRTYEKTEYSADHGSTWHPNRQSALKVKGKIIINRCKPEGEFAFNAIQRINSEYDPSYKWKP